MRVGQGPPPSSPSNQNEGLKDLKPRREGGWISLTSVASTSSPNAHTVFPVQSTLPFAALQTEGLVTASMLRPSLPRVRYTKLLVTSDDVRA